MTESAPLWSLCSLNDQVLPESTPPDYKFEYVDISNVEQNYISNDLELYSFKEAPSRARRLAEPGDLIVSTVRTYLRAIAQVKQSEHNRVYSTGFAVLHPNQDRADSRYLSYVLTSDVVVDEIIATSTGVSYPAIQGSELHRLRVPFHSLETQRRIADYLDRETSQIDAMINKLDELKATLETRRQTVISTSVIQNAQERPFLTCISRIVDYRGRTPTKTDSGIQLVTARNIRQGWIDYETSKEYVDPSQYESIMSRGIPEYGDLLFTMEAPLGYIALVDRTDIALAQRIVKWTVDESVVTPKFLMYAVLGDVFQSELTIRATGSTALGIKASKFSELRISLPPLEDQRRIADHLDDVTSKIDAMLVKVAQLKDLLTERRAALITDVVTGRKDVA